MSLPRPSRPISRRALVSLRSGWRKQGKRVVFTNGVFDILHRGHIELLAKARSFGDILIVGLNSDSSVRRLKGPTRPLNQQADRAIVLLALRDVDHVSIFTEDTPYNLIKALRPDVLVKGGEYAKEAIVGAELVEQWGGSVRRVKMKKGYSTTTLVKQMQQSRPTP